MKLSKKFSIVCANIMFAAFVPMCASSMSINVTSNLDNASGDIEVDGKYVGRNSGYDLDVYGSRASTTTFANSFISTGSAVNTATNLGFKSRSASGYLDATEKIGTEGSYAASDNSSKGEYISAATGLGVRKSANAEISTEGTSSSDPRVTYNVNKAQGNGELMVGAEAYSYQYTDTTSPATCPFTTTATKVAGSDTYYRFKQKTIGVYDYKGKFNIGR